MGGVTARESILLAHVPSHHVAKSQNGTMLSLRILGFKNKGKYEQKGQKVSSAENNKTKDSNIHDCPL